MNDLRETQHIETLVIGAGQAGLSVGYHLARRGLPFLILEANQRVGDTWRRRWDSLRLFTPARYDGLPGMPFPAPAHYFPTKDEMADYLEAYARRFDLPVETGVRVDRLAREGEVFCVEAGARRWLADNVVVAMASFQKPRLPDFAGDLDPAIRQLHSSEYQNPSQLLPGGVLIVGAGTSGSEIAMELAATRPTWVSGNSTGQIPFDIHSAAAQHVLMPIVLRVLFHRVLTVKTPLGRKLRPRVLRRGEPLIRVKAKGLAAAGVRRVPRTAGVREGLPQLEDGQVLDVANVIWCTGYHAGFDWIDLPVLGDLEPLHDRGIVEREPGLYFVGLKFLYAMSSTMIQGAGRDAEHVVRHIAARRPVRSAAAVPA